jgi:hypothetical protein
MDPEPAIFFNDLQDTKKKLIVLKEFFCLLVLKVHLHHFSKIKSEKKVAK